MDKCTECGATQPRNDAPILHKHDCKHLRSSEPLIERGLEVAIFDVLVGACWTPEQAANRAARAVRTQLRAVLNGD